MVLVANRQDGQDKGMFFYRAIFPFGGTGGSTELDDSSNRLSHA